MDKLYDYFIHYNPYTGLWAAVLTEEVNKYLSGPMYPHEGCTFLFAKSLDLLKQAIYDQPNTFNEDEHYAKYGWRNQLWTEKE
jgi:hypothetical protein